MVSIGSILIFIFSILFLLFIDCRQNSNLCLIILIIAGINIILLIYEAIKTKYIIHEYFNGYTTDQMSLVYGQIISQNKDPTGIRNDRVIYINDTIQLYLSQSNRKLSLNQNHTRMILSDQLNRPLRKLRIIPANDNQSLNTDLLYPIRYGDPIKLVFTQTNNIDYYICHNNGYLSQSENDLNNIFQFIKLQSTDQNDAIYYQDQLLIKIYSETVDPNYIGENSVGNILTNYDQNNACVFDIVLSNECNPNWKFDNNAVVNELIDQNKNKILVNARTSDLSQQIFDFQNVINQRKVKLEKNCDDQLRTIFSERAQLQIQINKLKN